MRLLTRALLWSLCALLVAGTTAAQLVTRSASGPAGGAVGGTCATLNALARFTAAQTLACSIAVESGTVLTVSNTVNVVTGYQVGGVSLASTNLSDTAALARSTNNLSFFASTTSAQLLALLSNPTGTGLAVFNNTPTFITPVLGAATGTSVALTATSSINANAASLPTALTGTLWRQAQADATANITELVSAAQANIFAGRRCGNTIASCTATASGGNLVILGGYGWDTAWVTSIQGSVNIQAAETWGSGARGTQAIVQLTPVGSTTIATALTLTNALATFQGGVSATGNATITSGDILMTTNQSIIVTTGDSPRYQIQSGATVSKHRFASDNGNASTTTSQALMLAQTSFLPLSGSASWATLHVNPTINGTSSGTAYGLGVASKTNTLTGGKIKLLSAGTATTDLFTGYTPLMELWVSGGVALGGTTDPGAGNLDVTGVYKVGGTSGLTTTVVVACGIGAVTQRTLTYTGGILTNSGTCA